MDDQTSQRLDEIESKVDEILEFTKALNAVLQTYLSSGYGKALSALTKVRGR